MSQVKRILVIDAHFETLAVTRAILERAGYWVRTVPSGEEGMLDLRQGGYDLLITDVRLPGISGVDLVRRVRRLWPGLPIVVLRGHGAGVGEREVLELGVWRCLGKPVEGEVLLTAVHTALHPSAQPDPIASQPKLAAPEPVLTVADPLVQRLDVLRAETNALGLLLAQLDGQIVARVGEQVSGDWGKVMMPLAQMMRSSVDLAEAVRSEEVFTLQYHDLTPCKLASATVGRGHFLTLLFESESRRSRVGTVWLFVQRAVLDLLRLLAAAPVDDKVEGVVLPEDKGADVVEMGGWEEPALDMAALGALLGVALDETAVPTDLDSFWSQAMDDAEVKREGMSLAEAQRRGIIPSGLDFGDGPKG